MSDSKPADPAASEGEDELSALQDDPSIRNPSDALIWSDPATPTLTAPPNIGARYYRSASARRRSSAASSRRNSLSSSQSHHSSRPYRRSSCNSNHVDQHLRRASILETRRARLADRAAHVEQVRLRAALAKAAPRGSNSEEKTIAAQQAREKYLAKVAASCAEEVNRAKRVAEEMKEKKAAEEERYRREMEEKNSEVERRRLEYRKTSRRPRASTANAEERKSVGALGSVLTQESAASRIQRAWRRHARRIVVKNFQQLDIAVERLRQDEFIAASELLASADAITKTKSVLGLLGLDNSSSESDSTTGARTFLSAFMILGHPTEVFNKNGQQEQDLISKATDMLISFESVLSQLISSSSVSATPTQLETLSQAQAAYLTAFAAWKTRDASILIDTMVDQFVAFDAIWQTVKDDVTGEVANEYRDGIRDQQVILLSKIKKLAGHDRANFLIKRAIRESRRQRSRRPPIREVRPRPLAPSPSNDVSGESPQPNATLEDIGTAVSSSRQDLELTEISRVFSIVPPNRVLVHELLIDPNHRIEASPQSDARSALNREVCDGMRRGIANGQREAWTVAVAENIRKRILRLLKPGNSMHNLLSEALDIEHVRNQCRQGIFSYDKFFTFMADVLPRLCAPIRDSEVQALSEVLRSPAENTDTMIEKLFGLLHIIDLMSLDYTNYMVQQAAPTLIREGASYEQRMFQADLGSNTISLTGTTRWWRNASVNVLTEASNSDPAPSERPSFAKIYARGLVDLALGSGQLRQSELPETLELDFERLVRIRNDMYRFIAVGGILLTAKNLLRRDVRTQWKPEAKRLVDALKDNRFSTESNDVDEDDHSELCARALAIVESSHGMPPSSRGHLAGAVPRFLRECRAARPADPVLKLLVQRLRSHLFHRLAAQSSAERVRVASTTSEGLGAIGLGELVGQVGACADELAKVAAVDQSAHMIWYRRVADELEGLAGAEP